MNNKKTLALTSILFICIALCNPTWAQVETRRIDEVTKKGMLDSRDISVIDRFMKEAVSNLTKTADFATARSVITNRAPNRLKKQQPQYVEAFTKAAYQEISDNLERVKQFPLEQRFMVTLNLLVLISQLEDPALTELAADYLQTEYAPIRYWAVRIVTGKVVAQQIRSGEGGELGDKIIKYVKSLTKDPSADVLDLVVGFAIKLGGDDGQDMLLEIAAHRADQYEKNSVENVLMDINLLKNLAARVGPENTDTASVLNHFNTLYGHVLKRYIEKNATLSSIEKMQLVSVIVEVEDKSITKLLKEPQGALKRALEREDLVALTKEYKRLLGDAGVLVTL